MKRILVAVLAVVALAGCSQAAPAPVVTVTQQAPQAPVVSDDSRFLNGVRTNAPLLASVPDSKLISTAHSICSSLDSGNSVASVVQAAIAASSNAQQAHDLGVLIGASVAIYCPSHLQEVQDFINSNTTA